MRPETFSRISIGTISVLALVGIFIFQRYDVSVWLPGEFSKLEKFLINRTFRFLLNDLFAIGLIYALFPFRNYVRFAVAVQIAGMILFLIPYFVLKVYHPTYNGPLLNFLHRIILNPVFLLLLIPAFYYQRTLESRNK